MSFPLLPDDAQTTPEADLAAAVQGQLAVPAGTAPVDEPAPSPIGRSWLFDFEAGDFVRIGNAATRTSSAHDTLAQWCLMAIHSTRFAHPVFSDDFGMEHPDDPFGELVTGEIMADYQRHLTEALLVHDRITSVENIDLEWDPSTGTLTIASIDVVTDEDQTVTVASTQLQIGGGE